MDSVQLLMKNIVKASSIDARKEMIHKLSKRFYLMCREEGMEREVFLELATDLLDVFTVDLALFQNMVTKSKKNGKGE